MYVYIANHCSMTFETIFRASLREMRAACGGCLILRVCLSVASHARVTAIQLNIFTSYHITRPRDSRSRSRSRSTAPGQLVPSQSLDRMQSRKRFRLLGSASSRTRALGSLGARGTTSSSTLSLPSQQIRSRPPSSRVSPHDRHSSSAGAAMRSILRFGVAYIVT